MILHLTIQIKKKQTKSTCQHQKYFSSENRHFGSLVSKFALGLVLAQIAAFLFLKTLTVLTSHPKNRRSGWVSCMTVPHEILPPFHLAGVGVGRQEESLTKDRRNTEEPLGNVLTSISHRQPHREAARPKGTSCSWSQLEAHSAKREEKANKASGPACYPHQANIPSICSHLILLHLPLNSPYHKGHVNV